MSTSQENPQITLQRWMWFVAMLGMAAFILSDGTGSVEILSSLGLLSVGISFLFDDPLTLPKVALSSWSKRQVASASVAAVGIALLLAALIS